jgi:hypothetical protein
MMSRKLEQRRHIAWPKNLGAFGGVEQRQTASDLLCLLARTPARSAQDRHCRAPGATLEGAAHWWHDVLAQESCKRLGVSWRDPVAHPRQCER